MVYKVGILGATGRMGQEVASLLHAGFTIGQDTFELTVALARTLSLTQVDGVPVKTFNDTPFDPIHVWIDFSQPEATIELLKNTREPVVICTTGFSTSEIDFIRVQSKERPILLSPNTSPGISFVLGMIESLPRVGPLGFDISIEEVHHKTKKDKPSGTAKLLNDSLSSTGNPVIEIHSVRAGGEKGRHRISFTGQEEEFVLEHRVFDRGVFARGAIQAAHFIVRQQKGLYSMKDVWRDYNG